MKNNEVYYSLVKNANDCLVIYIPDFDGYTQTDPDLYPDSLNIESAYRMAKDYIELMRKDSSDSIIPLTISEALKKAKNEKDNDLDFSDGIVISITLSR